MNNSNELNGLKFKVEKMFKLPDAGGLKAFFDFSVNDILVVRGARILSGKKGLFVSMPSEQGKDNRWYDQVTFRNKQAYDTLSTLAIASFNGEVSTEPMTTPEDLDEQIATLEDEITNKQEELALLEAQRGLEVMEDGGRG